MDLSNYEYVKYVCDNASEVRAMLEQHGVAIMPSILTKEECEQMKNGMWDYLETITKNFDVPIDRNNVNTWSQFKLLWPKHSMLLQQWSIGHAQFMWDLRQNPKILEVFSTLWEVEDLLVSFDGASFHLPPETVGSGWCRQNNKWLHSDQCFLRNEFECVQSWVTAYDVNPGDATLTFLEGSNKLHQAFRESKGEDTAGLKKAGDWYKLDTQEELDFYGVCTQKCISCPAGSIVLWDSRTIHSGMEALKTREKPNTRCVAYLCYTPRELAKPAILNKKIKAFNELRTTNHWPHKPKLFPKTPRTYGQALAPIAQIDAPAGITEVGRRLIGFDE